MKIVVNGDGTVTVSVPKTAHADEEYDAESSALFHSETVSAKEFAKLAKPALKVKADEE